MRSSGHPIHVFHVFISKELKGDNEKGIKLLYFEKGDRRKD